MTRLIRMHADDFFEAYRALKGYMDKTSLAVSGSAVVNLAFALELYIKELHVVLKASDTNEKEVKAPRGHNILELFRKLPSEAQKEIRDYPSIQKITAFYAQQRFPIYVPQDKNKKPITDILEQQIYGISDAFEKWRYSYEKRTLKFEEGTALALIDAIKYTSDKRRG